MTNNPNTPEGHRERRTKQGQRPAASRRRTNRSSSSGLSLPATLGLAVVFLLATATAAYLIFTSVRAFVASAAVPGQASITGGQPVVGANPVGGGGGEDAVADNGESEGLGSMPFTAWSGTDRVTVLVMGIDHRVGVENEQAYRTDSMMLLTLDPVGNTAGMLSIPRDLWVQIPGFEDRDRINKANFNGDAYRLPGGGPQLAMDTVELNLGIHVDYYVRVNFTAFETLIDEIGGITIENPTLIDDPQYPDCCYGYDPFYLAAGTHTLDGATALKYARTRHTSGGDFDRASRQQQVMLAVRDRLLSLDALPQLVRRSPQIYNTMAGSFDTNLTLEQIIALGLKAKDIPDENITPAVIDSAYIQDFYTTEEGAQVLILNAVAFRELRDQLFYTPTQPSAPVADVAQLAAAEAAVIAVQNGSGRVGLAAQLGEYLTGTGLNVAAVTNAGRSDYANTVIIDYTGRPYTTRYLATQFNVPSSSIFAEYNPESKIDVLVIAGADLIIP